MRILHVITAFHLGGTEQVAIDLAVWFKRAGHDLHVVAVSKDPVAGAYGQSLRDRLMDEGVSYSEIGGYNFRTSIPKLPLRLCRLLDQFNPTIVHSHADLPDFVVALTRRLRRFSIARTIHNTSFWPTHFFSGYLTERAFNNELVAAVSKDAMSAYQLFRFKYGLLPSTRRLVIGNGVAVPSDQELAKRRILAGSNKVRRIAFLGRRDRQKGLDIMLDALRMFETDEINASEFVIHTPGSDDVCLRDAAKGLCVPISFLPPIPNVRDSLHLFDLVVMPSRHEGLPLLAMESLAAGTPVLATRVPGLREALPPEWPLMVPPEDPNALADQIRQFLGHRYDYSDLRECGRNWIKQFSRERACQSYLEAYEQFVRHEWRADIPQ